MNKLKQIRRGEIIGKNVTVTNSTNKHNINLQGKIIDETKTTITIQTSKGRKMLTKNENEFEFEVDGEKVIVEGHLLGYAPEERLKR